MPKRRPPVHVTTRMPAQLLDQIDAQARLCRRNRSDWIRLALESAAELQASGADRRVTDDPQLELPL